MSYILEHATLGFCKWDIPAALILVGVCVFSCLRLRKMKQLTHELQERVTGADAAAAMQPDTPET